MTLASDGLFNAKAYKYTYADATARAAATGFTAAEVGVLALQLDDLSLWVLADDSPVTWSAAAGTAGMTNPMTTADDIIKGGASGTPTRVAKGGNNTVWGVDGSGVLGYKADPAGSAALPSIQASGSASCANNSTVNMAMSSEAWKDTSDFTHSNVTNNERIQIAATGRYRLTILLTMPTSGTGGNFSTFLRLFYALNGGGNATIVQLTAASFDQWASAHSVVLAMTAGDYIVPKINQNGLGTVTCGWTVTLERIS